MMEIIIWTVLLLGGIAIGKYDKTVVVSDDRLLEELKKLREDVAYYKKLTKTLVDENKELRKK